MVLAMGYKLPRQPPSQSSFLHIQLLYSYFTNTNFASFVQGAVETPNSHLWAGGAHAGSGFAAAPSQELGWDGAVAAKLRGARAAADAGDAGDDAGNAGDAADTGDDAGNAGNDAGDAGDAGRAAQQRAGERQKDRRMGQVTA